MRRWKRSTACESTGGAPTAGSRLLLPAQVFTARQKNVFLHAAREHPIYFLFPGEMSDDISIEVPKEWKVSSLPQPHQVSEKGYGYRNSLEESGGTDPLAAFFSAGSDAGECQILWRAAELL